MTTKPKTKMNESYTASSKGAQKRIRTPHPHDVLSGRGGGINSHVGNKTFREWVRMRKEDYNLAGSKAEKARVANEVIDLVRSQNPPGRFLQRENNSVAGPSWWIEVDEARALAKTSQALREGAPQIRAAHKDELNQRVERARKAKRRKTAAPSEFVNKGKLFQATDISSQENSFPVSRISVTDAPPDAPAFQPSVPTTALTGTTPTRSVSTDRALESLQRNVEAAKSQADNEAYCTVVRPGSGGLPSKPCQGTFQVDSFAETPPLAPMPSPPLPEIPPLRPFGRTKSNAEKHDGLPRAHSLALSDNDFADGNEEFVNPFADESDIYNKADSTPPPRPKRLLRNISSDEGQDKNGESNSIASRNRLRCSSGGNENSRSWAELSDIISTAYQCDYTDFGEGVKSIFDAVQPDSAYSDEDSFPALLMPWRGDGLKRGSNGLSSRSSVKLGLGDRQ